MREQIMTYFSRIPEISTKYITGGSDASTVNLTPLEQRVRVVTGTGKVSVVLPKAEDVPNCFFTLEFLTDGTGDVDLDSQEPTPVINLTFADAADYWVGFSNGLRWFTVLNNGGS